MNDLVHRLCQKDHPVEVSLRPERTLKGFMDCIGRGYIHIRFTNTKGGTELGVRLDSDLTDLSKADLENGTGTAHLVGGLTLDYTKVRCIADIDLGTLEGKGYLEALTS